MYRNYILESLPLSTEEDVQVNQVEADMRVESETTKEIQIITF